MRLSVGGRTILLGLTATSRDLAGRAYLEDGSQPTLPYHSYDGNNNGAPTLGINRPRFDAAGWPFVQ
jgi:arabinan endo-1,5-alpha-L-arabinosidase